MSSTRHALDVNRQPTAAVEYAPPSARAVLVLAPGAGAGQDHRWMVSIASAIATRGIAVVTFDFLYAHAGRRVPDRNDRLEDTWTAALAWTRARHGPLAQRIFIGGKSMGGRIATQVVARGPADAPVSSVRGLVLFGYPLHPPGKSAPLRAEHLPRVRVPMLFVQGSRDPFGTPGELRPIVDGLTAGSRLLVIDGGDHSLSPTKATGRTLSDVLEQAADEATRFIDGIAE